jgi:hypothetical protein
MHGVVSGDRSAGLFCVTWIPDDGSALRSARLRPRGLRADDVYRVVELVPRDEAPSLPKADVRGRTLELVGVSIEALRPLEPVLVKFEAVP